MSAPSEKDVAKARELKRCPACKELHPRGGFNRNKTRDDGLAWSCRSCTKTSGRRLAATPEYRKKSAQRAKARRGTAACKADEIRASRVQRKRFPEKVRARKLLGAAVKTGKLTRPQTCEHCSVVCVPHGHHEDYSKPLSVCWLCTTCHTEHHRRARGGAK